MQFTMTGNARLFDADEREIFNCISGDTESGDCIITILDNHGRPYAAKETDGAMDKVVTASVKFLAPLQFVPAFTPGKAIEGKPIVSSSSPGKGQFFHGVRSQIRPNADTIKRTNRPSIKDRASKPKD